MKFARQFETSSEEETLAVARELAAVLPRRGLVLLLGDVGAGKTTLTKGIAEALGAAKLEEVSSPTFTLIHEYGDPPRIYHVDLYRLDTAEQALRLGLDELFEQPALVLMEWGDRFPELLPREYGEIRIQHLGGDRRNISYSSVAQKSASQNSAAE